MSYYRSVRAVAIFVGLMIPAQALALEFVTVGPRAMGMGGAGVAITTDALATYWNPAGLAMTQTVDIRFQGSGQVIDRLGIADAVHDLETFDPNDPNIAANFAKAQDIANRINRAGATVSLNGSAGLYIKGHLGEHAFGVNISDIATGGGFVSTPAAATNNVTNVSLSGAMALLGLEVQGAAYSGSTTLSGGTDVSIRDNFGKPTLSTAFGIDVGAIYRPSSWLRFGLVAKDINQPTFDAPGGGELKLGPQVRGGVAINPYSSLTLTADVDATSNKTFVPGVKSQVLSLGAEQTIFSEFLSFRLGAFKNMKDAGTPFTPTAGLGLRIFAFRMDVGGGYDFREQGALVSGSVSMTF
jgi:hypothetical protein